ALFNFTDRRIRLDRRATLLYDSLLRTESRLSHFVDSWRAGYIHQDAFRLFPNLTMSDAPYQLWIPHVCERDAKGRYTLKYRAKRVIKTQDVINVHPFTRIEMSSPDKTSGCFSTYIGSALVLFDRTHNCYQQLTTHRMVDPEY